MDLSAALGQFNMQPSSSAEETAQQPIFSGKCICIWEDLYKRFKGGLAHSAMALGGDIFTYSGKVIKEDLLSSCTRTLEEFAERLGKSVATVRRRLRDLKDYIKKIGQSSYNFERENLEGSLYLRLPLCVLEWEFTFKYKDRTGKIISTCKRKLLPSEWIVLALIFTRCDNKKKSERMYEASIPRIVSELGGKTSSKTVWKAINALIACGLIFRIEKGVNASKTSTYYVDFTMLRKLEKARRKSKNKKPAPLGKYPTTAEQKTYYSELQHIAQEKAELAQARADLDSEYFNIRQDIIKVRDLFLHEWDPRERTLLDKELSELYKLEEERLKYLKIDPQSLYPKYYCYCKKCNDTGEKLSDHLPCDCYRRQ